MIRKKYIVTNFAYGTGPYLRTTQLALALNRELEKRGIPRCGIIIPLAYGDKQRKIILEEFSAENENYPDEILVDKELGGIVSKVLFKSESYEKYLKRWTDDVLQVSDLAHSYLSGKFEAQTLHGKPMGVDGRDIIIELNRSPRLRYDVAPSFFTSFAYMEEILERASKTDRRGIDLDSALARKAANMARIVEEPQSIHCIPFPGTFSWEKDHRPRYNNEILTPPLGPLFRTVRQKVDKGIYVTVTGIPGLERLYAEAKNLGIKLYSNDIDAVKGSTHVLPHIISDKNILFHFARSGWSSVWLSTMTGVPLVVPPFDSRDDPEIYFNNKAVEALGVGVVWRGENMNELLDKTRDIVKRQRQIKSEVIKRFGNWDGIGYCAKIFVQKYLNG